MNELEVKIKEMEERLIKAEDRLASLNSYTTIPLEVDNAFRRRLEDGLGVLSVSSKPVNSEDVSVINVVNFGTSTTTSTTVLDDPDGWLQITIAGITYNLPYYS